MPRLLAYAREKHVGIILWAVWKTLADQLEPALAQFQKWGVAGLKIDFMQRDDQPVIQFYWRVCRELAKRKMLVDFHGGIRAVLLTRTWPNLLTTEGVQGLEHDKWSDATEPEHDVTLALHAHVPRPDGLHAGRHAQRRPRALQDRSSTRP